jgi:hypothetical protein
MYWETLGIRFCLPQKHEWLRASGYKQRRVLVQPQNSLRWMLWSLGPIEPTGKTLEDRGMNKPETIYKFGSYLVLIFVKNIYCLIPNH